MGSSISISLNNGNICFSCTSEKADYNENSSTNLNTSENSNDLYDTIELRKKKFKENSHVSELDLNIVERKTKIFLGNNKIYDGQVKDLKPNGFGHMRQKNFHYLGYFKDGIRSGYGIIHDSSKNGIFLVSSFRDNKPDGLILTMNARNEIIKLNIIENRENYLKSIKQEKSNFNSHLKLEILKLKSFHKLIMERHLDSIQ